MKTARPEESPGAATLFTVIISYEKPLDDVLKVSDAHREYLDGFLRKGILVASGPMVPRTGGVIWFRNVDRGQVEAMVQDDPYAKAGVASFRILEFEPKKRAPDFMS